MAAMVGNMDGAAGAAEWADQGLISDIKLLELLLDRGIVEEERGCCATVPRSFSAHGYCSQQCYGGG